MYKIVGEFERASDFKIGDRVAVFDKCFTNHQSVYPLKGIVGDILLFSEFDKGFHFRQCRKLEESEPREWEKFCPIHKRVHEGHFQDYCPFIKVQEVLEND